LLEIKLSKDASRRNARWRDGIPSEKQIALVRSLYERAAKYAPSFPQHFLDVMRMAWREIPQMSTGEVSALIDVMGAA